MLISKIKATCEDCLTDNDKEPACAGVQCLEAYRMASPCKCTCLEMAFKACENKMSQSACLCDDDETRQEGYTIQGATIDYFEQPIPGPTGISQKLADIALKTGGGSVFLKLYAANGGTDINCRTDYSGWDGLQFPGYPVHSSGASILENPVAPEPPDPPPEDGCIPFLMPPASSGLGCNLTLDQLAIVTTGPSADCIQTGGRRAFMAYFTDALDQVLLVCVFGGITPPPRCSVQPCCTIGWQYETMAPSCGEDPLTGELVAYATFRFTVPSECTCLPEAEARINGTAYPIVVDDTVIDHPIGSCSIGVNAPFFFEFQENYTDACIEEANCENSLHEATLFA